MICLDCGGYMPKEQLKPCKTVYKGRYKNGVPICDKCCKACQEVKAIGGKKGCEYLENFSDRPGQH